MMERYEVLVVLLLCRNFMKLQPSLLSGRQLVGSILSSRLGMLDGRVKEDSLEPELTEQAIM
jgi:hypothetical protein